MSKTAFVPIILLIGVSPAAAQPPPPPPPREPLSQERVFVEIRREVGRIREVEPFMQEVKAAGPLLQQIGAQAKELEGILTDRGIRLSPENLMSLTWDAYALRLSDFELRVIGQPSSQTVMRRLQDVASDLALKVRFFRPREPGEGRQARRGSDRPVAALVGAPGPSGTRPLGGPGRAELAAFVRIAQPLASDLVRVVVNTKDDEGKTRNGYEVWYVISALEDREEFYRSFGAQSSPAEEDLPVANYVMWARAKDGKLGPKKPVRVGSNPSALKYHVDLYIP